MKFIYKIQYADFLTPNNIGYVTLPVGGILIPEDGKTELKLTPYSVVYNHQNRQAACMDYLGGFFGGYQPTDDGYIGDWTDDIDKEASLYYYVQGSDIFKMFITEHQELALTNIGGLQYVVNIDGKMTDCILEDDDIIFDSEEEANKYKNELSVNNDKS